MADSDSSGLPPKPAAHAAKPPPEMVVEPWDDELSGEILRGVESAVERVGSYLGQKFVIAAPGRLLALTKFVRNQLGFDFLVDLTAVDYPQRERRFELVYILHSFSRNERIRLKANFGLEEHPPSLTPLFPAANWLEREVFDMFGIEFDGHPAMRRLLLPDEWEGFPLRKDASILGMDQKWVQENLGIESGQ